MENFPLVDKSAGKLTAITILCIYLLSSTIVIVKAHQDADHYRCSHVPPAPEQVRHIWLEDTNFTLAPTSISDRLPSEGYSEEDRSQIIYSSDKNGASIQAGDAHANDPRQLVAKSKHKRHIGDSGRPKESLTSSLQETSDNSNTDILKNLDDDSSLAEGTIHSLWSLLKKLERPLSTVMSPQLKLPNELVPMRIQVHYDSSVYSLDKKKSDLIRGKVIPSVVEFFENALSIKQKYTIDKFRIARRCPNNTIYYAKDALGSSRAFCMDRCEDHAVCGEMIVPREHLSACSYCNRTSSRCTTDYLSEGDGVSNTQLLLYVSAKQTSRCKKDQTIAYAAHCAQDTKTDRPVAGHANLCPMSIGTDPRDLRALISTVKHELTHVLGFSVSLFAYYRDENGRPYLDRKSLPGPIPVDPKTGYAKWSDKVIRKVIRRDWVTGQGPIDKEVHLLVTPTVVREVRRHFNCSSLEGAELEDQGSDGTSMTHWEKRLFENEAMTGTHTQNSVYSRVTLAVLQDTGWYKANFSRAERLEWGKDLGCDFVKKSCKSWIDERRALGKSIRPFCDKIKSDPLQLACSEDHGSKAVCNIRRFKDPLPAIYRHFEKLDGLNASESGAGDKKQHLAYYGGSVDLADYCPFVQEFTWQTQNISMRGSRCDIGMNTIESERNAALEFYGAESRCFEHDRRWEHKTCLYRRSWHHYGAGCYKYKCTQSGHINVFVGNHSYPCYYPNQIIYVEQVVNQWLFNGTLICPRCEKICPESACQTYDKEIIDVILHRAHRGFLQMEENQNETLRSIFDEAYNMIDIARTEPVWFDDKSMAKYLPVLDEAKKLHDHRRLFEQPSLMVRLKENAPYIFTFPFIRQHSQTINSQNKYPLVCSSATSISVIGHSQIGPLLTIVLISLTSAILLNHV